MSLAQAQANKSEGTTIVDSKPWSKMSSPWGKPAVYPVACSLEEVMSEQLAAEMEIQEHEDEGASKGILDGETTLFTKVVDNSSGAAATSHDTQLLDAELAAKLAAEEAGVEANDELIARYLQREFDKEYDIMIANKEKKFNGTSKVSISFENYKMKHQREESVGVQDDEYDDEEELPEFPQPTSWESPKPNIGAKGYTGSGKNIITKHDNLICGRRNAERLMQFPPEYDIGDGEGMDMKLPNNVYNKLKTYSLSDNKKGQRVHEKKEHSTVIKAVDEKTRILMFKLVNSGFLASIDGVVSTGKEAVIFKASGGMKEDVELPKDIIMKVYKTTMNEFKTRAKYIAGDHRLSKDVFKKHNPRKVIKIWAEKECMNLRRMRRRNIPCPTPLVLKKHVLVMTCIGGDIPAPQLKLALLSKQDMQDAYEQTVEIIKSLYRDCGLVHADLSEFNLLWHEHKVWVIDVSQSVEAENATSNDFLLRDCQNVSDFFKQAGVHGVRSAEELFMDVTNYSLEGTGQVFASQVTRYQKDDYAFDYYFEQAESIREQQLGIEDSSEEEEEEEGDEEEEDKDEKPTTGHEDNPDVASSSH